MPRLKDAYIADVPQGSLMYPSSSAQTNNRGGNYYVEDLMRFVSDEEIFPAIVIPGKYETFVNVLTPSGVHSMSKFSLVSYEKA